MEDTPPPIAPEPDLPPDGEDWNEPEAPPEPPGRLVLDNPPPPLSRARLMFRLAAFATCVFAMVGMVGGSLLYLQFSQDLPHFTSVEQYRPRLVTRVYSADRRLIGEFGIERRIVVPYERIPKRLIQAFIAAEDKKFFDHHGIDYIGIVNAVLQKVTGMRKKLRGASTLTQQLAKSLLIADEGFEKATERSIRRKAREAILARRLEAQLNKEEILYLYLNQVYLGHGAYGVQAAAENYFRKDVQELKLAEMAVLAGLPQAPSRFSPFVNPKSARARQQYVLGRMVTDGYITNVERQKALAAKVEETVHARDDAFRDTAPYFTEHVRRYIYDTYGEKALYEGGLEVHTTLDLERQNHAEIALVSGVRQVDRRQGWRGPVAHLESKKDREKAWQLIEKKLIKGAKLQDGKPYLAVVQKVDGKKQWAEVKVGKVEGLVPMASLQWAREPNPNRRWTSDLVQDIRKVLKAGDVIQVIPHSRKAIIKDKAMTYEAKKKMPSADEKRPLFVLDQVPKVEGALVAMHPDTGYVEAMIGGYAFEKSEFNRAFQSCRMPGSAFKPILYSAAVALEGYNPGTMILDTPITLRDKDIGKSWKPQNFELEYKGEVTMREAVMMSMNIPALHTMGKVGPPNVLRWARHIGIKTPLKEELGTGIGSSCVNPWELTNAYTTFARMGLRPEPIFITQVIDRDKNMLELHGSPHDPWQTRKVRMDSLYRLLLEPPKRVMEEEDAYITHYLLTQVARHGTAARSSSLKQPVAGKTGTTNDAFDTWFVGYVPSLVASVWVGYDTMEIPLASYEQGGRTSLPIWMDFMGRALEGRQEKDWTPPSGICGARVDSRTGARVAGAPLHSFAAPFRCGDEPKFAGSAGSMSITDAVKAGGL
jgi:penicillin-binding protein 1A